MVLNSLLYYRSKLDSHDQQIYDDLFLHWMKLDDGFRIKKPHCPLSDLTQAIHWDNPILFYIDYYQISYAATPFSLYIKGGYLYSRDEIRRYLDKCDQWRQFVAKNLPAAGINEQALWLHDLIIANVRYGSSNGIRAHNMIGVIMDGEAVCEGISKMYKFLCDAANIPCILVTGMLEQEPHGWNMLWIGGGTSFVDVTNDIRSGGGYDRNHFLRSAVEMKGYTWDTALIPECKVRNISNAFFTARNRREVVDTIRGNSDRDSLSISLQFDHPLSGAQIELLINSCCLMCPVLALRKISYSDEQQMLYINKS